MSFDLKMKVSIHKMYTALMHDLYVYVIPANLQSTEVGIASHKNREIDEKTGKSS